MKEEFYWINRVNMVECGGPFHTIARAKQDAARAAKSVDDIFLDCVILRKVGEGGVTIDHEWIDAP